MDVVASTRSYLATWLKGGELECRETLLAAHCSPTDRSCVDTVVTAYHNLLCATLQTWSPRHTLSPTAFVEFVQSVLRSLPSSSSSSPSALPHAQLFGELLVDMIWPVDTELDEILTEAKTILSTSEDQGNTTVSNAPAIIAKARKAKQDAEKDRETVQFIVRKFLNLGIVSPAICRERLDSAVLASVGLITDKGSLDKKEIRMRTALFYKQNKFNLLREQSEGYSKLTVELTSCLGPSHSPATGRPTEPFSVIAERARPVWEKVISLIGYFDLDPNRALDIILDVFSVHLATHYSFFLALLSFSPWASSYRLPSDGRAPMSVDLPPGSFKGKELDEILTLVENPMDEILIDHPSNSPRVLAQVLGFKFAYYQPSDVTELTPRNLYLSAAVLIREGFITLEDLYPHLSPADSEMDMVRKEYVAHVQSKIAGAKISQLAMAAPLESAGSSSSHKPKASNPVEVKKTPEAKDANQKLGLLTALLAVGALKPAFAILSKFPWLVDARPEIADLVIRIMKVSIANLYDLNLVTRERNPSFTQPRARYGSTGVVPPPLRRPLLTLWAPTPPSTSSTEFVFFFPDWDQQVPICTSIDDLQNVVEPLMKFIGVHISRDPLFLTKFLRLGRLHLQSTMQIDPATKKPKGEPDEQDPIRLFWFKMLRVFLLPALPLIRGNAVCTVEIWNIIRQFETTTRWRLYGEWKTTAYRSHPELRIRYVQADRESKGILRRLAHNTIDSLSGTVAKLAHSNPCIFFANAVNQIMAYDNLANVVIQGLRYVTNMGFDVLVFIILDALANPNKDRLKDDGVNITDWLQSLASFTGMLFRRYSADLSPVLKYVVHQLHNGQTTELVVLKELIWKMAGIEPLPTLSDAQVAAMAGGPVLRIESVASVTRGARLDPGDAVLKGPQRLGRGLIDSGLALTLLIQVAQQRQACVFRAPDTHLKSLASLYDTTHGVLLQYLELLTSPTVISPQDYAHKIIPSISELAVVYGICPPICMQIIRPVLHASLLKSALEMQKQEQIASEEAEKRLKAALTAKREPSTRVASPSLVTLDSIGESKARSEDTSQQDDSSMSVELNGGASGTQVVPESPWLPELFPLFQDIKTIAPGNSYDIIGPGFYLTFWQLSTYDLSPPSAKYDEEGAALLALSRQEDQKYNAADRSADRSRRSTASSHRTRRERYLNTVMQLTQELKEQTASRAFTLRRLVREKQHWFSHAPKGSALVESIIEHCIQPRCLLSPMDADFCAQFIKVLHTQGTPGFYTLMCYDKLLGDQVKVVLFSCSEYEAHNYGRFLLGILMDLYKWHNDEQGYLLDNRTKTGGKTMYHPGMQRTWTSKQSVPLDSLLDWPSLQKILRKWHKKLSKCFIDCIQTGEYMHAYNAIIVMKELLPVFPLAAVADTGASIDTSVDRFLETEDRGDLKILARAYSFGLKKREALWAMPKHKPPPVAATQPKVTSSDRTSARPNGAPPSGPSSQNAPAGDGRRGITTTVTNPPSGPRAQLLSTGAAVPDKPQMNGQNSTKLSMDSIPRPEVVKRVRTENRNGHSPKPPGDLALPPSDIVISSIPPRMQEHRQDESMANSTRSRYSSPQTTRDVPPQTATVNKETQPAHRFQEEHLHPEAAPSMPPPSAPSQTLEAQELRETAKQTMARPEKMDSSRPTVPSPRVRSPSPTSRPGTRNPSVESRGSGGRSRSDRGIAEAERDDRRSERETRQEPREHTSLSRRDSLTHNRERSGRERVSTRESDKESERDKERDRGRDRHGDREKDRERDRETERVRDRERDREKDRDRERHRREDKDRDRDGRRDRDSARGQGPSTPQDERTPPTRPDPNRLRNLQVDDGLGKRRRPNDDDPDRGSKRSSRKDGHRDDRRRPTDKDSHDRGRDSERRRKERELPGENEPRLAPTSSLEKIGEKRLPIEGQSPSTSKAQPPSGPRAMASGDVARAGKGDPPPSRDRHRDNYPSPNVGPPPLNNLSQPQAESGSQPTNLQARIGVKDSPRPLPQAPTNSYRPDTVRKDEDRDHRKRTITDREQLDTLDAAIGPGGEVPMKRLRINRNRYNPPPNHGNNHAIARKLLPIDPTASDKSRGRKD